MTTFKRNPKPDHRAGKPSHPDDGPRFISRGVRIVHEDDQLLVVDKPAGIITADPAAASGRPAAKAGSTLFDILKKHVKSQPDRRSTRTSDGERHRATGVRLWIIHRLDKEASGLLVFAKTEQAFAWLKDDLRAKRIDRIYAAVAEGVVGPVGDTGTIQSFIREDVPKHVRAHGKRPRDTDTDDDQGKLAVTHYRVAAVASNRSLLEVKLDTGRKNQIRIHLAEKGFPLVGDRRFGAKTDAIARLALHAAELTLTPPNTGQPITFKSPAPPAFYRCVGAESPVADTVAPATPPTNLATGPAKSSKGVTTDWEGVADWYDDLLEGKGNDHYDTVVLPGALRLLGVRAGSRVLDVACGQGILSRRLASLGVEVVGVESSPSLVKTARERSKEPPRGSAPLRFEVADARELAPLELTGFDAAACVMALANIDPLEPVMRGIAAALKPGGAFVWIITHPAFRAAGQTSWGWDDSGKSQFRRVDGYLSPGQKKIEMNPGKAARGSESISTYTFHRPLQVYFDAMSKAGLLVEKLEEWPSLRASTSGPRAAEENRARREIPMFVGVRAVLSRTQ